MTAKHFWRPAAQPCRLAPKALMYPLLLLTGNVPLTAMLATTPQLATVCRELLLTASPPTVSRMQAPPTGNKL